MNVFYASMLAIGIFTQSISLLTASDAKGKKEIERDILLEKELLGVAVKSQCGGPKIAAEDIAGRTVLIVFGMGDSAQWNDFMVRMAHQYCNAAPPGGVVTLFVLPEKKTDIKWWLDAKGSPFVSFFSGENFTMPGGGGGGPRYVLFDADARLIGDICHDGRDLSGGSVHIYAGTRFTPDMVRKAVESGSGSVVHNSDYKECTDLMRALVEGANTASPLIPILSAIRTKAKDGKGTARAEAQSLMDDFKDYLAHQNAVIERNITINPVLASRILKRIQAQLSGDKELSAPFDRLQERLKLDKSFQDEVRAGELLWSVRTQAAWIQWGVFDPDFPVRPKDKIAVIKQGLEQLLSQYPNTRAALIGLELKKAYTQWVAKAIDPLPW